MRERERERRLAAKDGGIGKKSKITRDRDCDINEKFDLGMSSTKTEVMYDKRLFNQDKGMSCGFACNDQYNVYESGLITAHTTLPTLYRPKKDIDCDAYGGADEQMEKIMKTDHFKPDKGFTGTSEKRGPREMPIEFQNEEADPFGPDHPNS